MLGFDGTWPSGQGSLAGQGCGICVLKNSEKRPHQLEGIANLQGTPSGQIIENVQKNQTRRWLICSLHMEEGLVQNIAEDTSSDQHLDSIRKET